MSGSRDRDHVPFSKISSVNVQNVYGNMHVKFKDSSFNLFGAISIYCPNYLIGRFAACTDTQFNENIICGLGGTTGSALDSRSEGRGFDSL